MRSDDIGMFWQDMHNEKGKAVWDRPLAPIPMSTWRPPDQLPDLSSAKRIAIDVETYDPELKEKGPGVRRDGHIVGLAIGVDDGERFYLPMRHKLGGNLAPEQVLQWAKVNLTRPNQPKVGANLLYDLDYLQEEGVKVEGPFLDVQIAAPLLDENKMSYALDVLGWEYLAQGKSDAALYEWCSNSYGGKSTRDAQATNIWRAPTTLVGPYAEGDVDLPLRIIGQQLKELEKQELSELFQLESELMPMVLAMRRRGVRVNVEAAEQFESTATDRIKEMVKGLGNINVNSGEDLFRLCKKEGITVPTTDKGNPSFRKDWLQHNPHPKMRQVSEIRTLMKLRDTFVKGYILGCNINGRIHCSFNQLRSDDSGTVSGRFSSSDPNLQNIPTRTPMGKAIRAMFLPDEDEEWGRFDWSQIEYRLLTHYAKGSGSEEAREMYRNKPNTDFHQMVCDMISKIIAIERSSAKNINFGLVYGMGEELLASILGVSKERALDLINAYHRGVPFVRHTANMVSKRAKVRGYIHTLLKRRRRFPDGFFTHKALNALLQGGNADIMKAAMVMIWKSGVCDVLGAPLLTVHDELDWSVPKTAAAAEAMKEVHHIMETCVQLRVPIIAAREFGADWGHLTKFV